MFRRIKGPRLGPISHCRSSSTQSNHTISTRQQLYTTDPVTPGSIFFLPHGTRIFNKLVHFMKNQQTRYGFQEVITPLIYKNDLWKTSGHWQNYRGDMFMVGEERKEEKEEENKDENEKENGKENGKENENKENVLEKNKKGVEKEDVKNPDEIEKVDIKNPDEIEKEDIKNPDEIPHSISNQDSISQSVSPISHSISYALKPMNCPGHCIIYSKFDRSYNELPIRYSDFSSLHRNEASGALSGLTRVRRFHQDDGHIFCTMEQIEGEISRTISLIRSSYHTFGIKDTEIDFFLSTRPLDKYIGDINTWDRAEDQLRAVLDGTGKTWSVREGDGAFYGPKIDVLLTDAFGKKHQVGTVQLDFQLPARFALKYVSEDGNRDHQPIMIHRAVFGSLERFLAILLDHYQGKWPFWLNPRQAVVIPVNDSHVDHANRVKEQLCGDIASGEGISPLTGYNFYVDVDDRKETVGSRIKEALEKGYSFIVMVGDREVEKGTIAVRTRESRRVESVRVGELYERFMKLEREYK